MIFYGKLPPHTTADPPRHAGERRSHAKPKRFNFEERWSEAAALAGIPREFVRLNHKTAAVPIVAERRVFRAWVWPACQPDESPRQTITLFVFKVTGCPRFEDGGHRAMFVVTAANYQRELTLAELRAFAREAQAFAFSSPWYYTHCVSLYAAGRYERSVGGSGPDKKAIEKFAELLIHDRSGVAYVGGVAEKKAVAA